jgi:hypothetical protein
MAGSIPITSWSLLTRWCGLGAFACYFGAAFLPLPEQLGLLLAFLFGPLFMLASLGLYRIVKAWKDSLWLQAGFLFNVAGTALVTLMLAVQQTSFAFHDQYKSADRGSVTDEQLRWIFKEVNAVQLGIDIAWDVFISLGTLCLAMALWRHPVFGRGLTVAGVLVALLLLTFNMVWFPEPPADAGSIDFGPLVALWYMALAVWLRVRRGRFVESGVFG